jgi:hypothetical protein
MGLTTYTTLLEFKLSGINFLKGLNL